MEVGQLSGAMPCVLVSTQISVNGREGKGLAVGRCSSTVRLRH